MEKEIPLYKVFEVSLRESSMESKVVFEVPEKGLQRVVRFGDIGVHCITK